MFQNSADTNEMYQLCRTVSQSNRGRKLIRSGGTSESQGGGGGGGTLIFSHIRRLELFFGVLRNIFLGYEDFLDIFWGHHKIRLV